VLARDLGMRLHWLATEPIDLCTTGIATLTAEAVPVREVVQKTNLVQRRGTTTPAAALGVRFAWGGRDVVVWNTALPEADVAVQYAQLRWLDGLAEADQVRGYQPLIGGSFGLAPDTTPWEAIEERMEDVWPALGAGQGYTAPSVRANARHDYLLVERRGAIVCGSVFVVNALGVGAHLPIIADLYLAPVEAAPTDDQASGRGPVGAEDGSRLLDEARMEPDAPLNERGGRGGIEPGERLPDPETERRDGPGGVPGITEPFRRPGPKQR
jgi:hypothetical protein